MVRGFVLSVPQMEIIGAMLAHMKLPRRGFIIKGEFDYNKQTKVSIPGTRVNKNKYDTKLMDRAWERSRRRRAKLIEAGLLSHTGQRMVY